MQHQEVVLVEALRSPIGRLGGQLANVRPDDLLAEVVRQVVARSGIDPTLIDQVYAGAANQAGEDNRNVARMATLLAGLPDSVPGVTVNRLCASGLEAVVQGYRQIALSEAQCVVAGGVESMSRAPYVLAKASKAFPVGGLEAQDTCLGWRFKNPKLEAIFPLEAMGCTAENLADDYQISRREQDEFALASQNKAIAAIDAGDFKREIVPIEVAYRKHTETVDTDEGPRRLEPRSPQRPARCLSRRRKRHGRQCVHAQRWRLCADGVQPNIRRGAWAQSTRHRAQRRQRRGRSNPHGDRARPGEPASAQARRLERQRP